MLLNHRLKPVSKLNNCLSELNSVAIVQTVMATDITVRAIATYPIVCNFRLSCLRYFQAYQSPNGARKKLIRYMIICFETDIEGMLGLSLMPQLRQKLADDGEDALQAGQTVPTCVPIAYEYSIGGDSLLSPTIP
jgi:hypothetical protein